MRIKTQSTKPQDLSTLLGQGQAHLMKCPQNPSYQIP